MEKTYLTYEEFGAVGDGVHDHLEAIIATHNAANERKLPVKANDSATYYIGGKCKPIIIKSDSTSAIILFALFSITNPPECISCLASF